MKRRLQLIGLIAIVGIGLGTAAVNLRAYVTNGHVWGTTQVRYYVNPNNLYVSSADAIADIQQGANDWNSQAGINLQLVYNGTGNGSSLTMDNTNNVFFRNDASGYIAEAYWWWDGTGKLVDADIVFHQNYKFYAGATGCNGDGYYIANTVAHEFGHILGLGHSGVSTATMWATENACETDKEVLDADDIAGIRSLYPPSTGQPPAAPSVLTVVTNASNPSSSLSLGWGDSANNENGYRVDRSTNGVTFGQVAQLSSNATGWNDNGLSAATTYWYRVYAYNNSGSSPFSNVAEGQTQSFVSAPSSPANPSPSNGGTGVGTNVTLSWTSSNAQSYDVYINGAPFAANLTSPSIPVSSLTNSTTYTWSVVAKNNVGSTQGPTWSFTTKAAGNPKKGGPKR